MEIEYYGVSEASVRLIKNGIPVAQSHFDFAWLSLIWQDGTYHPAKYYHNTKISIFDWLSKPEQVGRRIPE